MRKMTFGQRLRMFRVENDMTQEQLATAFSHRYHPERLTKGGISMYELGKRIPETPLLVKIAEYFGVSVDYLLGLSDVAKCECGKDDPE